ncbi:acyl-CoA N-acyltransferase [Podospora appendiculata]|uniref:Acyl-CoA N-acyltransferase n=1 Tax=Podospora appendiculata TaxID=314037 RepID=A0AAE1C731_9PEZI|nr:acyl-CoA N-acyltransferase [Podospora appendiculata]
MLIRLATACDLDAMTWVLIGAAPLDPVYPYRYPDRHLYSDEFAELCRRKCYDYLATSIVVACEMAPTPDADPEKTRVVAFCAWDPPRPYAPGSQQKGSSFHQLPPFQELETPSPTPAITIGNKDRMDAFRDACAASKASFFDARYRCGHMFLKILLCHPDYQRRGAGRALTNWGIEAAQRLGLNTTVFASPMGYKLYRKLGFKPIGKFRVQLEGEEAFLVIPALVLRA